MTSAPTYFKYAFLFFFLAHLANAEPTETCLRIEKAIAGGSPRLTSLLRNAQRIPGSNQQKGPWAKFASQVTELKSNEKKSIDIEDDKVTIHLTLENKNGVLTINVKWLKIKGLAYGRSSDVPNFTLARFMGSLLQGIKASISQDSNSVTQINIKCDCVVNRGLQDVLTSLGFEKAMPWRAAGIGVGTSFIGLAGFAVTFPENANPYVLTAGAAINSLFTLRQLINSRAFSLNLKIDSEQSIDNFSKIKNK